MELPRSHLGAPRACSTCARSKAKCVPGNETGEKCQRSVFTSGVWEVELIIKFPRCQRLDKPCEPSIPTTRKRKYDGEKKFVFGIVNFEKLLSRPSRRVTKAQVEKLEQKVEGLVTLLTSTKGAISSDSEVQVISREENRLFKPTLHAKQICDFRKCQNI